MTMARVPHPIRQKRLFLAASRKPHTVCCRDGTETSQERQYNLEAAGYDYQTVQDYVNRVYYGIGGGSTGSDWIADVAYDVYLGNYGNGQDRYDRLTAAGYDYQTVQDYVNSVYYGI